MLTKCHLGTHVGTHPFTTIRQQPTTSNIVHAGRPLFRRDGNGADVHSVGCGCEVPRFVQTEPWRPRRCGVSCANVRWVPEGLLRARHLPWTEYFAGGAIHYFAVNHPQPGRGRLCQPGAADERLVGV